MKIYFRAEGNSKIGLGHVIRSLALADMLNEEYECHFIIRNQHENLKNQILEVCKTINYLPDELDHAQEASYLCDALLSDQDIVVLDGYHFTRDYQKTIKNKGCKLVCIDDIQHTRFIADAVINHAPGLSSENFSVAGQTRLYFGSDYALLRFPFLRAALQQRCISDIETIFVCFGGADFNNLSLKVLELFSAFKGKKYNINMVLGGANVFKDRVKAFAKTISSFTVTLYENLCAEGMVKVMQQSDCAVVPASSIMYEVLAVKMPIIGGYYVDNQLNIYNGLNESKLIRGVGDLKEFSDYESALGSFTQEEIAYVVQRQEEIGIAQARDNFLSVFRELSE